MIPPRRFSTLLHQARAFQRQRCIYHNSPSSTSTFSLYSDHQCSQSDFPRTTTTLLEGHTDEVWNIEWSHNGLYLASASKDHSAIIWHVRVGPSPSSGISYEFDVSSAVCPTTWFLLTRLEVSIYFEGAPLCCGLPCVVVR